MRGLAGPAALPPRRPRARAGPCAPGLRCPRPPGQVGRGRGRSEPSDGGGALRRGGGPAQPCAPPCWPPPPPPPPAARGAAPPLPEAAPAAAGPAGHRCVSQGPGSKHTQVDLGKSWMKRLFTEVEEKSDAADSLWIEPLRREGTMMSARE